MTEPDWLRAMAAPAPITPPPPLPPTVEQPLLAKLVAKLLVAIEEVRPEIQRYHYQDE